MKFLALFVLAAVAAPAEPVKVKTQAPTPVKIVIVTTFEVGENTGDRAGEFQLWYEREKLHQAIPFPGEFDDETTPEVRRHPLMTNGNGIYGLVSGTTVRASNTILALGLDQRFDFSKTYWIINGIAGVDPEDASLGSAAWAQWIIDGDVAYEVDSREAPADWPYGVFPVRSAKPNQYPPTLFVPMAYPLNAGLVDWAYRLTKDTPLEDNTQMQEFRQTYTNHPNARKPPFVLIGDSLGSCRFWHGKTMTQWANDWTKLWTRGEGNFVMTNMEDQGIAAALKRLERAHRVDFNRVLVLRTASNYSMQPSTEEAAIGAQEKKGAYVAWMPALEAAWRVGSKVVHELADHWDKYRDQTPR